MVHWSKNPEIRDKVMKKLARTQFKKGDKSWNDGLTSSDDNRIPSGENHSKPLLGIKQPKHSKFMKEYLQENGHPMEGKSHSEESKKKMSDTHIGKESWNKGTKGIMKPNKTSFDCGEKNNNFKKDWSNQKKENHWNWKGGITSEMNVLRNCAMYQIWRNAVYLRDNFTCQNSNCEYCDNKRGGFLNAHHIKSFAKYSDLRFNIDNGITYCRNYHAVLECKIRRKQKKIKLVISG